MRMQIGTPVTSALLPDETLGKAERKKCKTGKEKNAE